MFNFEEMISAESKVVMVGLSKGYTDKNFSKSDLMKSKRVADAGTSTSGINGKNSTEFDREGKWMKKVAADAEKAKKLKENKKVS